MFYDGQGLPGDSTGDFGDSCHFAGVMATLNSADPEWGTKLHKYANKGILCRHPSQAPWNNPRNFSRDQLIAWLSGAKSVTTNGNGSYQLIALWHLLRLGFCQNWERDKPGSTKYPWPHWFINDHGKKEFRWFDCADILSPSDWAYMIMCLRIWWLYWLVPMGWLVFTLELRLFCAFNRGDDDTNMILKAGVFRLLLNYVAMRENWKERLKARWTDSRLMPDVTEGLINLCNTSYTP